MAKRRMNNEGSVFFRKNRNVWVYEVPAHLQIYAKAKTISAKTQRELKVEIDELNKQKTEKDIELTNITIVDILNDLEEEKYRKNIISNQTFGRNKFSISIIEKSNLGQIPIQQIQLDDLNTFSYSIITYSQSTINKVFIMLKKAFEVAEYKDILLKNIAKFYEKPISNKKTKKVSAFTIEEQKEFIKLIPNSIYFMQYLIALNTGMRMGEINAIKVEDIDFKKKTIHINKTVARDVNFKDFISDTTKTKNGIRFVPINDILMPYLVKFCENKHGYLFSNERVISTGMVNSEMKRLCEKSEMITCAVNTHMLRHTFATRCIESGMPAVVLAKILGHADISTTLNTYTDVFNKFKKEHFEIATEYFKKLY